MLVMLGLKMLLRSPEMSGPLTWRLLPWDMPFGIRLVAGGMASSSLGRTLWDKASSWRGRAAQVLWVFGVTVSCSSSLILKKNIYSVMSLMVVLPALTSSQ